MALLNSSSHSQLNTHRHYLRPLEPSTTTPLRRKVSTPRGFPIHKFPISITFSSSAPSTLPRHSWALPSVHYRFHRPSASPPTVGPVDPPAGDCALDSPRRRRPEVRSEDGRHCAAESSSTVSSCLWERSSIPLGRWCPGESANWLQRLWTARSRPRSMEGVDVAPPYVDGMRRVHGGGGDGCTWSWMCPLFQKCSKSSSLTSLAEFVIIIINHHPLGHYSCMSHCPLHCHQQPYQEWLYLQLLAGKYSLSPKDTQVGAPSLSPPLCLLL